MFGKYLLFLADEYNSNLIKNIQITNLPITFSNSKISNPLGSVLELSEGKITNISQIRGIIGYIRGIPINFFVNNSGQLYAYYPTDNITYTYNNNNVIIFYEN